MRQLNWESVLFGPNTPEEWDYIQFRVGQWDQEIAKKTRLPFVRISPSSGASTGNDESKMSLLPDKYASAKSLFVLLMQKDINPSERIITAQMARKVIHKNGLPEDLLGIEGNEEFLDQLKNAVDEKLLLPLKRLVELAYFSDNFEILSPRLEELKQANVHICPRTLEFWNIIGEGFGQGYGGKFVRYLRQLNWQNVLFGPNKSEEWDYIQFRVGQWDEEIAMKARLPYARISPSSCAGARPISRKIMKVMKSSSSSSSSSMFVTDESKMVLLPDKYETARPLFLLLMQKDISPSEWIITTEAAREVIRKNGFPQDLLADEAWGDSEERDPNENFLDHLKNAMDDKLRYLKRPVSPGRTKAGLRYVAQLPQELEKILKQINNRNNFVAEKKQQAQRCAGISHSVNLSCRPLKILR